MNTPDQKQTDEDRMRDALKDLVVMIGKLAPYCTAWEDMVGMINLATQNDGQLRMLMKIFAEKK